MRDALGPGTTLGYCTNVHPGATLAAIRENLETHATAVRDRVCAGDDALGIGLWLPASAARELREREGAVRAFADWLAERRLDVFTINGFPYGDFHQPVVKHAVYEPNWTRPERLAYTIDLMHVLAGLRPASAAGSISTLPLGWPIAVDNDATAEAAAAHLRAAVEEAARIEADTGRLIHINLEPEPGCRLERSGDVVAFFTDHLLRGVRAPARLLRHLRVCHDVCHAAVMFEEQAAAIAAYDAEGIAIGKVQVSSGLRVRFDVLEPADRVAARDALGAFTEDRFLHQTAWRGAGGDVVDLVDDLPDALAALGDGPPPPHEWRIHFHVPVFIERFGFLETTRDAIPECLRLLAGRADVRHFEVETYAWNVLPPEHRPADLAAGIAQEIDWVRGAT